MITLSFVNSGVRYETADDVESITSSLSNTLDVEHLTISGCSIGVGAGKSIANILQLCKKLTYLFLPDIFTGRNLDEIPQILETIFGSIIKAEAKIEVLDLSDNAFGPNGIKSLCEFIEKAENLKALYLNNVGLGFLGAELLKNSLIHCYENSTDTFKLDEFYCGRNRLTNNGAFELAECFSKIVTLKTLSIPQNGISYEGFEKLCNALLSNKELQVFDVNDNLIAGNSAIFVASMVENLENLQTINLGDCLLRKEGAIHMIEAFKKTKCNFTRVCLDFNELDFDSADKLLKVLSKTSGKMIMVELDGNCIGFENIQALKKKTTEYHNIALGSFDDDEGDSSDDEDDDEEEEENDDDDIVEKLQKLQI